eukprot:TRINITY_DN78_c0_g1_i1.p1 TRINITY_DN78_c0_g1~~TRINITY_DN78_c0_g1_i1.p1  ORF type:complete len:902 (-),score=244.14 TRINITY_DN78_c0_g1_i1:30-2735(-)
MRKIIILVLFVIALVFAQDKPSNYFAGSSSARGQQQEVASFAVWNTTSNSWMNVLPPTTNGPVFGIVAIGNGLLAYGDFTAVNGNDAAGLAYYDGKVWCSPEGVGLFQYDQNVVTTQFNNTPTAKSSAFAATVIGNDVYLLGTFDQVGLIRDGVAGFVKLTWSTGGIFTINKVGTQGYYQVINNQPCTFCPQSTQPTSGVKLLSYTANSNTYFVLQVGTTGDLFQWQVDTPNWVRITNSNGARNITGNVRDFDINNGIIYVVGNFQNLNDPSTANQYLHIASSSNQGASFGPVATPNPLPVENFGDLGVVNNATTFLPALTGSGLFSIAVESATSIYVAGGWRVTERNLTIDNLAGQLQTRVIRISGSTYSLVSERFAGSSLTPQINKLIFNNGVLYAFGDFTSYRQVVPTPGSRFGVRFTEVYRNAAKLVNGQWSPAFGGYLTTDFNGDASPSATDIRVAVSGNLFYFAATPFLSSYGVLSGSVFAYGGDKNANRNNRWNAVLQNQRFASASNYAGGISAEGNVYSLHVTKKNDALIIGGMFDWIGSQRIGGIAAYNPVSDTVQQIGGGIYQANNNFQYYGDNTYNNRVGGKVYDIEEWNDRLIIGGLFNRNNSGNCVSNIAWNKFRVAGAGWEAIDGGCDGQINDLLVVGNILYITGTFKFCGLNPSGYNGGLYRGSIPTNGIARIDLSDNKASWRNLGVGLAGTGTSLAWRGGDLFVGGTFTNAGGRIASTGIARWRGNHWENVVAKCRGYCDRAVDVLPYIGVNPSQTADERKPVRCLNLRNYGGRIYCIDNGLNVLAWFDSNTWHQGGAINIASTGFQNSLISRNGTNGALINVYATYTNGGANGANFATFDSNNLQYTPSHGGFSVSPSAMADGSFLRPSFILATFIVLIFAYLF